MRRALAAVVLFVFWLVITGSVRPFDLGIGVALSIALAYWADHVLWIGENEPLSARAWLRVPQYLAWLLKEIVVAAVYVAERVLDPHLGIAPSIHEHRAHFERDVGRVALANSITLTPGTITIDVREDTFVIHCLNASFSDSISSGDMERRVAKAFDR